ncbi:Uncharacterised protein [Vibrio cholerae]|uniref:Uncharacterized protein n=1 Tax=Vibrio cholerae TaxID=666 RepID=A0A656A256_VIBCL|nr:Uncharacterised protein [Vibrio cholerae]CSB21829.1 Uncharacterised protein [Vibrio cholerae]CSC52200.1 Uncharacterised protein [Vibrio cholerae]CSC72727.1 Uncharacterised protein [Vibrio cholerae]CSC87274.1 Uncharacterised protein [Vibrio cholerae]
MSFMVLPERSTNSFPLLILLTESEMSALISFAALAERCASERTSEATTENPRPCSPALAASTAALSARILVWKAIPSITPIISAIFCADSLIEAIVTTTCSISSPPLAAISVALPARMFACMALSEFCRTVLFSSSMLEAVCSRLEACCSVRLERSVLPLEISVAASLMVAATLLMSVMI